MKIVVVISTLSRGGAQRVVSILTREWAKRHHVVIALFDAAQPANEYGGRIVDLRLPAQDNRLKKVYRIGARSLRLARLFRQERPDRIASFMECANFPAIAAATMTRLLERLWVSVHTNPTALAAEHRAFVPWLYRLPSRVIAVSKGVKRALEDIGVPTDKVAVIPNPVVPNGSSSSVPCSSSPGRFILGAGRLHREKGFDRLVEAFSDIEQMDLNLVILGDGRERAAIIAIARELGVDNRVYLPGAVSDIETWYRRAECFVLTSRCEGWPNVLMEAMSNGCPVVSFDCRYGPSEIVEHGKSGLLVAEGNIDGITQAIDRIVTDHRLRTRLVEGGKKRVRMFVPGTIAPCWLAGIDA